MEGWGTAQRYTEGILAVVERRLMIMGETRGFKYMSKDNTVEYTHRQYIQRHKLVWKAFEV
jgi:hypothetical protein